MGAFLFPSLLSGDQERDWRDAVFAVEQAAESLKEIAQATARVRGAIEGASVEVVKAQRRRDQGRKDAAFLAFHSAKLQYHVQLLELIRAFDNVLRVVVGQHGYQGLEAFEADYPQQCQVISDALTQIAKAARS